ncbi:MAG: ATP-binding protein [Gordonibacter sp.]|uniref:AAA family ATPase n=1 Tax=Gordonibacter sp. TaxID=1968902 RepID=UPI002FC8F1BF
MATSEQLIALVKAHYDGDSERVKTVVLQIAAHEAKIGHSVLAQSLKELVLKQGGDSAINRIKPIDSTLIIRGQSKARKSDLIVSERLDEQIDNIILEFAQRSKLNKKGYAHRRKILLEGLPGTGKTLTASVFATELKLPLFLIQTDKLVSKYMGETGTKLRQVFDSISQETGVYFFDEFDSIGSERAADNDVKEMHRVLNLFLQFIEQDTSDSIILAASNSGSSLDQALFRRFDDVLQFSLPSKDETIKLFSLKLNKFNSKSLITQEIVDLTVGLCHADITKACENAIKQAILADKRQVSRDVLIKMIEERRDVYRTKGIR